MSPVLSTDKEKEKEKEVGKEKKGASWWEKWSRRRKMDVGREGNV